MNKRRRYIAKRRRTRVRQNRRFNDTLKHMYMPLIAEWINHKTAISDYLGVE